MKTLANCTPREFLRQTNRIRKAAARWMDLTGIMEIRKRMPEVQGDREALRAQAGANVSDMLDAALEGHPDETAELLGLMCFIEPEDLDNHGMNELIGAAAELLECREIIDFFISLARLERLNTSAPASR